MSFSRQLARSVVRGFLYPLIEGATLLALAARRRLLRSGEVSRWQAGGGQRVFIVAAHPDDETIGCAGAVMAHLASGDRVDILMVTDGSGSRAGGLSPEDMAKTRSAEANRVAEYFGGATVRQLGLRENHWHEAELLPELQRALGANRYDIVYAPSCVDFHPEHMKVARALAQTFPAARTGDQCLLRVYEMQVPLGVELTNVTLPLGRLLPTKEEAIGLYRSQRGALDLWKREARYLGAMYGAGKGAEAYWEMSPSAYARVMQRGTWDWRNTPFSSLSGRPFGDARAHLRGRAARLELLSLTESVTESQAAGRPK
jgi:LmbE family N-acetylglucosaminyl deacetylase